MMIHEITAQVGAHKRRKRLGRGMSSGHGKTCGRGSKGAGSRSGWTGSIRAGREGGQMPFFRRIPKRGFSNALFKRRFVVVNLKLIEARFEDGATVGPAQLVEAGLIHDQKKPVKILAEGQLGKKIHLSAASFSESAVQKVHEAGGTTTVVEGL